MAVSDLSSWDSTEEDVNYPDTSNNQAYGFGMKHSEGMMDLSKVLSEEKDEYQKEIIPDVKSNNAMNDEIDADRIYDSVENLTSKDKELEKQSTERKDLVDESDSWGNSSSPNILSKNNSTQQIVPKYNNRDILISKENINGEEYITQPNYDSPENILQSNHEVQSNNITIVDDDDESDWDSPPLSENNAAPAAKVTDPEPVMNSPSNSTFSPKQSNLMTTEPSWNSLREPDSKPEKNPSPSLHKVKEVPFDGNIFSTRKENNDAENQQFSSLPPNSTKQPEKNSPVSNSNW